MGKDTLQSVERSFLILELLSAQGSMGVREIAEKTELSVTIVHRILTTLVELGYLTQSSSTHKYQLTFKLLVVGETVAQRHGAAQLSHAILKELAEECKETVHFVERVGNNIRYIDKINPSSNLFATGSYVGLELPMTNTAVGKAILASLSADEVKQIWNAQEPICYTAHTICELERLQSELEQIRSTGFGYDREERELGLWCVGVSVVDYKGEYRYGISISAPATRMSKPHLQKLQYNLIQAKKRIVKLIGKDNFIAETNNRMDSL